jgi:hypothetical protein
MSCSTSLSLVQLNGKYLRNEKPISNWDIDLINARNKAFEQLNFNFDSVSNLFLIEKYDVANLYYSGLLYINQNNYHHFSRAGFNSELKITIKELTKTEKFIVAELKEGRISKIKEQGRETDLTSAANFYITIAEKKTFAKVRFFKFQEFYID